MSPRVTPAAALAGDGGVPRISMIFTDRGRGPDEEECRQPGRRETHATSGAEGCAGRTELEAVQASQRFRSIRGRDPPIHMWGVGRMRLWYRPVGSWKKIGDVVSMVWNGYELLRSACESM